MQHDRSGSLPRAWSLVLGTVGAGSLLVQGSAAHGGTPGMDDALVQIAELKQELAEFKQQESQGWLTEQRSSEIRGIVQDVLADAETRTGFQDSGMTAGWNKGFFLASPDGNFKLKLSGQVQVRYVLNHADGTESAGSEDDSPYLYGMENRRTKLKFSGHIFNPSWTYEVKGGFSRSGGAFGLEDAWLGKDLGDGFKLKVGQFKAPWLREEMVSSSRQLTVERSIVNEYFNQGYSQGLQLSYGTDDYKLAGWIGDGIGPRGLGDAGFNSMNTPWDATTTNYSFAARGEWKMAGEWSQFKDFSSRPGSGFGAMMGVSGVMQRAGQNAGVQESGTLASGVTADLTLDFDGASMFLSGVWTDIEASGAAGGATSNPFGVTIQGGYYLCEDVEIFGRYEYMDYDYESQPNDDASKFDGFTVGANWFLNSAVKLTVDWTINFASLDTEAPNNAFVSSSAGFRPDQPGQTDQWALRAQLQLLF